MSDHVFFFSVPGLRPRDVDRVITPTLFEWASKGSLSELTPTFPCVTSCVQASMLTGAPPSRHGVIANGFYYPDRHEVEMWTGWNSVVQEPQVWDAVRSRGLTSAVWHAQNIKGAAADFIVTPAPIHEADGSTKLWCYSKPDGLYQQLLGDLGHFPLQHYWGPLSNIESTRWILRAAQWLVQRHNPSFNWIYVPHLDYAMQKYGPDGPQARAALTELDAELSAFKERATALAADAVFLVAGEYAMTQVSGVVYPNRVLRQAGLLEVEQREGCEYVDLRRSSAFAMVDHQFAHVFIRHEGTKARRHEEETARILRNLPGIADVVTSEERARIGMDHARSGDVILICDDAHWMAYYWWLDDAKAPPFARTVDIHRKPGYDPVELFFDPKTRGIAIDASLVRGSHGVPATQPHHKTALVCSCPWPPHAAKTTLQDTDLHGLILGMMNKS